MVNGVSDSSYVLGAPEITNWGILVALITIPGLVCRSALPGVGGGLAGHGKQRLGHFTCTWGSETYQLGLLGLLITILGLVYR